jgi:hypothetical protein
MHSGIFPKGNAKERDRECHAGGFVRGYELHPPPTVSAFTETLHEPIPLPDVSSFSAAAAAIILETFFQAADTIVILTDTDPLSSSRLMKHFEKLGPILFDRTTITGPCCEQWAIAFHQTNAHDSKIHCAWSAIFLLEALMTAVPWKHYILQDHDNTPLSLFEVQQMVHLVKTFHLPYFTMEDAHPGIIIQNEESTPANAGQVIFPARNTRKESAAIPANQLYHKLTQDRNKLIMKKLQAPQQQNTHNGSREQGAPLAPSPLQTIDIQDGAIIQSRCHISFHKKKHGSTSMKTG